MRLLLIIYFFSIFHFICPLIRKLINPLLPFNLQNSRVISGKHTFVSYINVTELYNIQDNFSKQLGLLSFTERDSSSELAHKFLSQTKTLFHQTEHLLQAISPKLKRTKRGLINLGGKISKWLFGTLDADDGHRMNKILNHLQSNDHLIQVKVNEEISIAKELITKTNESLSLIKSNIEVTRTMLSNFRIREDHEIALVLLLNSMNSFLSQLHQIINAITFAYLNKVHPMFLPLEILATLLKNLNLTHSGQQLPIFRNIQSFYQILGIQLRFTKERIIFLIHCPLLSPDIFKTYFLHPVPIHGKILLPTNPYLILNEKNGLHQYEEEPCEEIEDSFYCLNHLSMAADCVTSLILYNKPKNCTSLEVQLDDPLTNQISPQHLLCSTSKPILLIERCNNEERRNLEKGSYLLTIPKNCSLTINSETFTENYESIPPLKILHLPYVNLSTMPVISRVLLRDINVGDLQALTKKIQAQVPLILPDEDNDTSNLTWYLLAAMVILIPLAFGILAIHITKTRTMGAPFMLPPQMSGSPGFRLRREELRSSRHFTPMDTLPQEPF